MTRTVIGTEDKEVGPVEGLSQRRSQSERGIKNFSCVRQMLPNRSTCAALMVGAHPGAPGGLSGDKGKDTLNSAL